MDRTLVETILHQGVEVGLVVGDRRTAAAEREAGADDGGQTDELEHFPGMHERPDGLPDAGFQADLFHRLLELVPVFGFGDDLRVGADHLAVVFFQHTLGGQFHRQVQTGLPA